MSETNYVLDWAVKENRDGKYLDKSSAEYCLLQPMICLENIYRRKFRRDNVWFVHHVAQHRWQRGTFTDIWHLLSLGNKGNDSCHKRDVHSIEMKGDPAFLRSDFILLCMWQQQGSLQPHEEADGSKSLIADTSTPELRYEETTRMFHNIMTNTCNARFGKLVKTYAEMNAMKGKEHLAFCASLLAPLNDSSL